MSQMWDILATIADVLPQKAFHIDHLLCLFSIYLYRVIHIRYITIFC